jgi:hypothetical protein
VRKVSSVNNYLIPTELIGEVLLNFRLRINNAPNLIVSFSTDTHLLSLEFDDTQYGTRKYKNDSFKIENKDFANFFDITGNEEIQSKM